MTIQVDKPSRATITIGWDDVPWLDEQTKREILASTPPHLRATVSRGVPTIGSGAIYPIPLENVVVDPFPIPAHYKKMYGMDVGWRYTAAVFGALDPDTDVLYIYDEYIEEKKIPELHAAAIKRTASDWMIGAIDPAAAQGEKFNGDNLLREYRRLGLRLREADNGVGDGIYKVWSRLELGKLKFFNGVTPKIQNEYLIYRRDENGKIVKEHDHCMDALRYMCNSLQYANVSPAVLKPRGNSIQTQRRYNV